MQVFILGAQKIKGWFLSKDSSILSKKLISGQSFLEWNINSLNEKDIDHESICLIAGYRVKEIQDSIPDINYIINPKWDQTHVVGSLRYALDYWKGEDILIFYADTLFKPNILKDFIGGCTENMIASSSLKIGNKNISRQTNSEKIVVLDNYLRKSIDSKKLARKHFTGLTFIKKATVKKFKSFLNKEYNVTDNYRLSEALIEFVNNQTDIKFKDFDIDDSWVELDSTSDITRFIFGSKAETLNRVKPFIKKSIICDQIYFDLNYWNKNKNIAIKKIKNTFDQNIIIRSSSLDEDSWENSQAGSFISIKDINPKNQDKLVLNIEKVFDSYTKENRKSNLNNQILIQPYIKNALISGVVFSKTLEEGAPYYCISYNDLNSDTDVITSGNSNKIKTFIVQRDCKKEILNSRILKIINSVSEIEKILEYSSLDIEFIIDNFGKIFIVQIRPISSHKSLIENEDFSINFNNFKLDILSRLNRKTHLSGDINLLSDMSDWNPAEMIGVNPKPLSLSLYMTLITDSTWRVARSMIGYNDPSPEKLLFCMGGHPYIDLRNSLNNLIPSGLSKKISNKLLNHYLRSIKQNINLHDKVEFEVAITCYTPDIDFHLNRLKNDNFTEDEIKEIKCKLKILTEKIISQREFSIEKLLNDTLKLDLQRKKIIETDYKPDQIPNIIKSLIDKCINFGTLPFSILARYGFIGASSLNGLVRKKIINSREKNQFLNSIETIVTDMSIDMSKVIEEKITIENFLKKYGHLRPSSYNIESFTYKEKPRYYLPNKLSETGKNKIKKRKKFFFKEKTKSKIDLEIKNMNFNASELLKFIQESTVAREYSKFQFTKTLSNILDLIVEYSNYYGLNRNQISFISINDFIKIDSKLSYDETKKHLNKLISRGENWYFKSKEIVTPSFISSINDVEIIKNDENLPNFVSTKNINSKIVSLKKINDNNEIINKIVLIEGADPGYDWIFLYKIKGLITKYGGAASHMTIRCSEFGLPAAIGCGDTLYNQIESSNFINLNCSLKKITILK